MPLWSPMKIPNELVPDTTGNVPVTVSLKPIATLRLPVACARYPKAMLPVPEAIVFRPKTTLLSPLATVELPKAVLDKALAVVQVLKATLSVPTFASSHCVDELPARKAAFDLSKNMRAAWPPAESSAGLPKTKSSVWLHNHQKLVHIWFDKQLPYFQF